MTPVIEGLQQMEWLSGKSIQRVLHNQIITRYSTFKMNVELRWEERYEEAMVVATTVNDLCKTNKVYGKRFWIEPMHKDWKTNAFYLENTRVTDPKRIVTLLIPIAFAYVLCVLEMLWAGIKFAD
ncbi:MAG: hypothetical protein MUO40_06705 [Anaerolineaceae bacterium]|nr:hypothetical protein [Anaerolineaceae bacterium]